MLCLGCPRAHPTLAYRGAFSATRAHSNPKTCLLKVLVTQRTCEEKEAMGDGG